MKKLSTFAAIVDQAIAQKASDIHLIVGSIPTLRVDGELLPIEGQKPLEKKELETLVRVLMNERQEAIWDENRTLELIYASPDGTRLRTNIYWEKYAPALAARLIPAEVPTLKDVQAQPIISRLSELTQGLILVTGPTGCGKSSTLAAMLDYINNQREENIVTLEDPIEFIHTPKHCLISQRQVGEDVSSFPAGLKSVLRQDPNVILVGEMRDLDTISTTMTLAETGHLVLATLHTNNAAQTIDRVVDVFPPHQQDQIRLQLSLVLRGILSQILVPAIKGGRLAVREILLNTPAIANLIREHKTVQITGYLSTNEELGMQTMDQDLQRLFQSGEIDKETAQFYARDPRMLRL